MVRIKYQDESEVPMKVKPKEGETILGSYRLERSFHSRLGVIISSIPSILILVVLLWSMMNETDLRIRYVSTFFFVITLIFPAILSLKIEFGEKEVTVTTDRIIVHSNLHQPFLNMFRFNSVDVYRKKDVSISNRKEILAPNFLAMIISAALFMLGIFSLLLRIINPLGLEQTYLSLALGVGIALIMMAIFLLFLGMTILRIRYYRTTIYFGLHYRTVLPFGDKSRLVLTGVGEGAKWIYEEFVDLLED